MIGLAEVLLERLAVASMVAGAFALVAWLVSRYVRGLSPAAKTWLWWAVCAKFVLALCWPAPLELAVLPAAEPAGNALHESAGMAGIAVPHPAHTAQLEQVPHEAHLVPATAPSTLNFVLVLASVWLAGVAVTLTWMLVGWGKSANLARRAHRVQDARVADAFERIKRDQQVKARLRAHPACTAPLVTGLLRPVVIVPSALGREISDDEIRLVLAHELMHVARRDLWLGTIPALAERLFFFHPLARLAAREYVLAREAACDDAVVAHGACRATYGRLLIKLGTQPVPSVAVASIAARGTLKRRLEMLANDTRLLSSWWVRLGALVAAVALIPIQLVAQEEPRAPVPPAAPPAAKAPAKASAVAPPTAAAPDTPAKVSVAMPAPARAAVPARRPLPRLPPRRAT